MSYSKLIACGVVLWVFTCTTCFGQDTLCNYTIEGYVLGDTTGTPLSFAEIKIAGKQQFMLTDKHGYFKVNNVCPGNNAMQCDYIGYKSLNFNVFLKSDTTLYLHLHHTTSILHSHTISARIYLEQVTIDNKINKEMLRKNSGRSIGEITEQTTGVSNLQTGANVSKPVIHGLHSNRIAIINNGLQQEDQQWGIEHAPLIDPYIAEEVQIVKGAAALQYGTNAMAGAVIITPPALPDSAPLHGKLNMGAFSNNRAGNGSLTLQGGIKGLKGFGWRTQGSLKKGGDHRAPDYFLSNTGVEESNYSAALGYRNKKWNSEVYYSHFNTTLGILRSAHIGNITDFINAFNSSKPFYTNDQKYDITNPKQEATHDLLKGKLSYNIPKKGTLEAVYGYQYSTRKEFDIRRGGRSEKPALDMEMHTQSANIQFQHKKKGNWKGTIGLTGLIQKNRNVPGTGVKPLIPWYDKHSGGIYVIENYRKKKLGFEIGTRYDYTYINSQKYEDITFNLLDQGFTYHSFSFITGGVYEASEHWVFKTTLGSTIRPPHVNELLSEGLHHSAGRIEEGDTTLVPEKSYKLTASVKHDNHEGFEVELSPYVHYINDFIFSTPDQKPRVTIRGTFPVFRYLQRDALLFGADLSASYRVNASTQYQLKASYLAARDVQNNDAIFGMPPANIHHELSYRFRGKALQNLKISLSQDIVFRQTAIPDVPEVDTTSLGASISVAQLEAYLETLYSAPKTYSLLHLELDYQLRLFQNNFYLTFSINNLLNTKYRSYLNTLWYYADEPGRNFSVRLQYEF